VLHRVAELADRPPGFRPSGAAGFTSLVQLPEIMSEILATGPKSKKVVGEVGRLVAALGPELTILRDVPLDDLRRAGGSLLSEAIARLRRGEVIRDAGYDGEYGTIRLFKPDERNEPALFSLPNPLASLAPPTAPGTGPTAPPADPPSSPPSTPPSSAARPPAPQARRPPTPPALIPSSARGIWSRWPTGYQGRYPVGHRVPVRGRHGGSARRGLLLAHPPPAACARGFSR